MYLKAIVEQKPAEDQPLVSVEDGLTFNVVDSKCGKLNELFTFLKLDSHAYF